MTPCTPKLHLFVGLVLYNSHKNYVIVLKLNHLCNLFQENRFSLDQLILKMHGARLDVGANGFWKRGQNAYSDVKVFNPFAPTLCSVSLPQIYRCVELEKKWKYEERVREVEHGSFLPLVFSYTGCMGPLATVVFKQITTLLSEKHGQGTG